MKIIMKIFGILALGFGIYLIGWGIVNRQIDEYTFYGILICIAGVILSAFGFSKINKNQEQSKISNRQQKTNCANHPEVESIAFCEICKKPICVDCTSEIYSKYYCESCKEPFLNKLEHTPYKSKTIAVLLCLVLGVLGIHRIYLGHPSGSSILVFHVFFLPASILFYIPLIVYVPVTFILAFVGLLDLISIAGGNTKDVYGRDLL